MKYKILIVSSNYYKDISKNLLRSSTESLKEKTEAKIIEVPGSFEIPVIISKNISEYDGFIALGCIIKGETPHFDFISQSITNAIMELSVNFKKPIGNGIITSLNKDQALVRSYKKGIEATEAILSVLEKFE
tara:strand:- start:401 stop:796 length:396 start_codon:yes stop_codon:yes gene_type:complete